MHIEIDLLKDTYSLNVFQEISLMIVGREICSQTKKPSPLAKQTQMRFWGFGCGPDKQLSTLTSTKVVQFRFRALILVQSVSHLSFRF